MVVIVDELSYTKDHLWARVEGALFVIGITDYAQKELGEAVYVELPREGAAIARDELFGSVESITSMSDLYSPVSGE